MPWPVPGTDRSAATVAATIELHAAYDLAVSNSRLVYSTGDGDRRRKPAQKEVAELQLRNDGVVRIFRGKGGRGGTAVSVVRGLPPRELAAIAKDLKRHCGSGGTVKDGAVELQGDHREKIAARLTEQGYQVKLAGG